MHIAKQRFDFDELLGEVAEESRVLFTSHDLVFEPTAETAVTADRDKISQVIHNLISNAVKYSPAGSTIRVTCTMADHTVIVCVHDNGFGIDREHQQRLFERFYRVKESHSETIAGFGIGLYLCSEIIHRHGGKIWVESDPGKGSMFCFSLPLSEDLSGK